jgi:GH35 family endo-1,4-beta-xylanase
LRWPWFPPQPQNNPDPRHRCYHQRRLEDLACTDIPKPKQVFENRKREGHDFSRAAKTLKICRASAPEVCFHRNAAILAICTLILTLALPASASAQSLRELADRAGSLVGTAVRPAQFSETAYACTLGREFKLLEPEDTMKWWVIRPDPVTFDFTQRHGEGFQTARRAHRRGRPVQMHLFDLNPDIASIEANIARFAAFGVQVHITEMDVGLPTAPNGEALKTADLERQSEIYGGIAWACLSHPGCTAIQTWGFPDKYSWIRSKTKGMKGAALLFDRNYAPNPACIARKQALTCARPQK